VDEFELIRRHFTRPVHHSRVGVGDDAALLYPSSGMETAVATDMLVCGTHFLPDADPYSLGMKALAVNLSDLGAMGATPRQALLGIALPSVDVGWVERFADGFAHTAERFGVDWVGGDTTRGPLNLCVTVLGELPAGSALLRSGARLGDVVWVSGVLGLASLGLRHRQGSLVLPDSLVEPALARLDSPEPRVALGVGLRGLANACIDLSDGLLADLGHVLKASRVGVELDWAALPRPLFDDDPELRRCVLSGGDDYELLFTASPRCNDAIVALAERLDVQVSQVGRIVAGSDLLLRDADGARLVTPEGYRHFA